MDSDHEFDDDIPMEMRKVPPESLVKYDNGKDNSNVNPLQYNSNVNPLPIAIQSSSSIRNSEQYREYQARIRGDVLIAEEDQYHAFKPRNEIQQPINQRRKWRHRHKSQQF